jgi:hypothetical protein
MKIIELLTEAPPGTSGFAALKGAAKQKFSDVKSQLTTKLLGPEKQRIAKQNQKKWYDAVKRKQQKNINMTDEDVYRNELYKYLGSNGKLKLSRELKRMVGQLPLTDQNILSIMTKTIDDRIAAKEKLASAPKPSQSNPAASGGAT